MKSVARVIILFVIALSCLGIPASTLKEASAHSGTYVVTKSNGTYLRNCPSTSCKKRAYVANGELVEATKHRGNWGYFVYGDYAGWMSLNAVDAYYAEPTTPSADYCVANTWGQVVCAPDWIGEAIVTAADAYGVSRWYMLSLAACESNFNPDEYSWAGAVGIFQFLPDTFYEYGSGDVWAVWDQSYVAASMVAAGLAWHWDCAYRV